jgi:hypothetical protein
MFVYKSQGRRRTCVHQPCEHACGIPSHVRLLEPTSQILHAPAAATNGARRRSDGDASGSDGSDGSDSGGGGGGRARWDKERLRALCKEVDILSNLRHPNVVMFMGVCLQPPCVVTEYCALGERGDGVWLLHRIVRCGGQGCARRRKQCRNLGLGV